MNIFIITETLLAGGAEWFALRLAASLQQKGHRVNFIVTRPDLVDKRLTSQFKSLHILHAAMQKIKLAVLGDRVLHKLTGKNYFLDFVNSKFIREKILQLKPDVLHSHLFNTDNVTVKANRKIRTRHIVTVHGDYIQYLKLRNQVKIVAMCKVIESVDKIAVISDEQQRILESNFPAIKNKLLKVYNGYPLQLPERKEKKGKTFNFGLIARGIPEKGWEPAIKAFQKINDPDARLILYGESEFLNELKNRNTDRRILFSGFTDNPLEAVGNLDVGLLPSYYEAESLPTTVIEYLALNKPVIATDVGEINKMITAENNEHAGIIIYEKRPDKMVEPLYHAMQLLLSDTNFYNKAAANCSSAFDKFSMEKCLACYTDLYQNKTERLCVAS